MAFEFATAQRIIFGDGVLEQAGTLAAAFGRNALVVAGANRRHVEPLLAVLRAAAVDATVYAVHGEPDVATVAGGAAVARENAVDLVLSIGGGKLARHALPGLLAIGGGMALGLLLV